MRFPRVKAEGQSFYHCVSSVKPSHVAKAVVELFAALNRHRLSPRFSEIWVLHPPIPRIHSGFVHTSRKALAVLLILAAGLVSLRSQDLRSEL
jgi:hypothetical protein